MLVYSSLWAHEQGHLCVGGLLAFMWLLGSGYINSSLQSYHTDPSPSLSLILL